MGKKVSISQLATGKKRLHLGSISQVHRLCIFHKQPRIMWARGILLKLRSRTSQRARLLLSIGRDGQLHTSIYDKRDDFNFHITNFPFLSSNISSLPAYGVLISQFIWYTQACYSYECFILRIRRLSSKLFKQGYLVERLKSSFRKFMVDTGILFSNMNSPLTNVKSHHDPWPTGTSQPIRLSTNFMTLIPSLTFTEFWVVSMEYLQRVWHASWEPLPFRTLGSVPLFGTCLCYSCWDQIYWTCCVFTRLFTLNALGTFSLLLILSREMLKLILAYLEK